MKYIITENQSEQLMSGIETVTKNYFKNMEGIHDIKISPPDKNKSFGDKIYIVTIYVENVHGYSMFDDDSNDWDLFLFKIIDGVNGFMKSAFSQFRFRIEVKYI